MCVLQQPSPWPAVVVPHIADYCCFAWPERFWGQQLFYFHLHGVQEYDNAALVMMAHSPVAWEHVQFKDVAVKVSNVEVYYRAVSFYLEQHPDLLVDLLKVCGAHPLDRCEPAQQTAVGCSKDRWHLVQSCHALRPLPAVSTAFQPDGVSWSYAAGPGCALGLPSWHCTVRPVAKPFQGLGSLSPSAAAAQVLEARVDHARVVGILRKADHLPLIKDYLLAVQKANLAAVNEAVNELLVEEDDFSGLRESITTYDNYDQVTTFTCILAQCIHLP